LVADLEYRDHFLELADGLYALDRRFRGTPRGFDAMGHVAVARRIGVGNN
jgi:hypothetical protein